MKDQLTIVQEESNRLLELKRIADAQVAGMRSELEAYRDMFQRYRRLYGALRQVEQFHEKFGVPVLKRPTLPDATRRTLRSALIAEETAETLDAIDRGDLVEIADGLADVIYVCLGTALEFGIPLGEVFDEVHSSNMKKAGGGENSKGKIMKPEGWVAPDVKGILRWAGMSE